MSRLDIWVIIETYNESITRTALRASEDEACKLALAWWLRWPASEEQATQFANREVNGMQHGSRRIRIEPVDDLPANLGFSKQIEYFDT